jgi:Domain of unknown function (DUF4126)
MDWTQALASALGLGFLAGIRLYGTVLAVGLAVRFGLIQLPAQLSQLHILADNRVLAVAGVAFLAEFFADKVPWIDSTWDAIHTFIRPIGAAVLGATAVWHADPATQMAVALLSGGVALAGHSAKAATRYAVNHSPEPFSNIALSLAGDLALPFGVWLWAVHPYVMLACVIAFLVVFAWLAPKIVRFLRVEWVAFTSRFRSAPAAFVGVPAAANENLRRVLAYLRARAVAVPGESGGIAAAGYKSSWHGSIGYLCPGTDGFTFLYRRWSRRRQEHIPYASIQEARVQRRFLTDELILDLGSRKVAFDVFKLRGGSRYRFADS